ncbi:MAG: SCO family protein [Actinomycetota bacterium]
MASPGAALTGTTLDKALSPALLSLPLTDEHGKTLTLGSLSGKTIVLVPFLTTCQETCPMTSVNMRDIAAAVKASGQSSSVVELEITVDPGRDEAARLAAYQKLYGSQPGWDLATAGTSGTSSLWRELGVYYAKVPEDNPPPKDWQTGKVLTYDVAHQDVVFVVDGNGHIRWLTSGAPNTAGVNPPVTQMNFLSDVGRKNLASPPEPSWTVADVERALSTVGGHHIAG